MAVVDEIAPLQHPAAGRGQVDGGADRRRREQGRRPALLAQIFEQHRPSQRVTDGSQAIGRQVSRKVRQQGAEVLAAAGIVLATAGRARRSRAPEVHPQHAFTGVEQAAGHAEHVGAFLRAGQPVDEDRKRRVFLRFQGPVQSAHEPVARPIAQIDREPLRPVRSQIASGRPQEIGDSLEVGAPPGEARTKRREMESHPSMVASRSKNFSTARSHHGRALSWAWKPMCPPAGGMSGTSDGFSDQLNSR